MQRQHILTLACLNLEPATYYVNWTRGNRKVNKEINILPFCHYVHPSHMDILRWIAYSTPLLSRYLYINCSGLKSSQVNCWQDRYLCRRLPCLYTGCVWRGVGAGWRGVSSVLCSAAATVETARPVPVSCCIHPPPPHISQTGGHRSRSLVWSGINITSSGGT